MARKITIPLAPILGISVGLTSAPKGGWRSPLDHFIKGEVASGLLNLQSNFLFYDWSNKSFDLDMGVGVKGLIAGLIIHKVASKLGVNAALGRANVPLIRI